MEIPDRLKDLYQHWDKHSRFIPRHEINNALDQSAFNEICRIITERMLIWERKELGLPRPYTDDRILNDYRFCNIYRELDRQTIEIHEMLKSYRDDLSLWLLNAAFCRFICNTATVKSVGLLSFDETENLKVYENLMNLPSPKYGDAYIFPISTIMKGEFNTREKFFCLYLPKVIPEVIKEVLSFNEISVKEALERILPKFGYNFKFHWTEILIDLAYQFPDKIDLFKKFPIGPGSIPTMKRLAPDQDVEDTCLLLINMQPIKGFPYLELNRRPVYLSAENWEGVGCESRKYRNLTAGGGRKRRYTPSDGRL